MSYIGSCIEELIWLKQVGIQLVNFQVPVHKAVNLFMQLIYAYPFLVSHQQGITKHQHLMIAPRLPSVKKRLTERSVFNNINKYIYTYIYV